MSDCEPYQVPIPWASITTDWRFPEQGIYINVLINLPLDLSWNPVCSSFVIHLQFISFRYSLTVCFWEVFQLPSFEVLCFCPPILYCRRVENFKLLCFPLAHCQFTEYMEVFFFFLPGPLLKRAQHCCAGCVVGPCTGSSA